MRFRTLGSDTPFGVDTKEVNGIIYGARVQKRDRSWTEGVFSLGRIRDTNQICSAVFIRWDKPAADKAMAQDVQDLIGVRLGLGRIDSLPRGYRVWCSRLAPGPSVTERMELVRKYPLDSAEETFDELRLHVSGFDYIRLWLANRRYAIVWDKGGSVDIRWRRKQDRGLAGHVSDRSTPILGCRIISNLPLASASISDSVAVGIIGRQGGRGNRGTPDLALDLLVGQKRRAGWDEVVLDRVSKSQ